MFYEKVPESTNVRARQYYKLRMRGKLRPCQKRALKFMRDVEDGGPRYGLCGGLLCLTMGLGKSVSAAAHSLTAPGEFPTLIVCSKTLMGEWRMECMHKFFNKLVNVLYLHKDYMEKEEIQNLSREEVLQYDFVVTTYDFILGAAKKNIQCIEEILIRGDEHSLYKDKIIGVNVKTRAQSDDSSVIGPAILFKTPWERVFVDESQRMANPDTMTWRYMMAVYGKYKWCLTGTPIRNYASDIWAQLRWCGFEHVDTKIKWKKCPQHHISVYQLLRNILSMDYTDAGIVMPQLYKVYRDAEFTPEEKKLQDSLVQQLRDALDSFAEGELDYAFILALLTKIRQCCIAPYITTKESKRKNNLPVVPRSKWIADINGTAGIESTRMKQMIEIISEIPENEKILVFTSFSSASDVLAHALRTKLPDVEFTQIDGDVTGYERDMAIHDFRKPSSTIQVCIMTYKVGGEGLNLTCATHCIMLEPWWNYAVRDQAEARAWRTGQTKPVTAHYPQIVKSLEFEIEALCQAKKRMAGILLSGERTELPKIGLSSKDVLELVRRVDESQLSS
jgi:SNF2 family DNA or RNA helicase